MDWERPPQGRGQGPGNIQDLEEIFKRFKGRYSWPSLPRGPFLGIVVLALLILLAFNCFYTVQPQETAVVQRFGRFLYMAEAGWHFKAPFGIDAVRKVVTGRVLQREYGYRTVRADVARSRFQEKGYEEESALLSGDLNVVNLHWAVQYKIDNPRDYLFQVHDVEGTLDDISESVVRRIVGNRYADEVLTIGRASIADMARDEIQYIMDAYRNGLKIVTVKLQNVNPPDQVKSAFNEVNEARQEKERMVNEAQQAYNEKIPKAMGEARQTITQAEGYALERVNRGQGEVSRFLTILEEYRKAPDVTRRRMYLESFGDFVERIDRLVVVDENQKQILPLLDLARPLKAQSQSVGETRTEIGQSRSQQ
jgi:membrane protease subunit HflK